MTKMNLIELKSKKGLDIPIKGEAPKTTRDIVESITQVAIVPDSFPNSLLKPVAKAGEKVKAGQIVLYDKKNEQVKFTSPVSGVVKEIRRGEKRRIIAYVIEKDGSDNHNEFKLSATQDRSEIISTLLESGLWTAIRQRPFGIVAEPEKIPDAIYITASDTAPLAPDYTYMLDSEKEAFEEGIKILKALSPKVNITVKNSDKDFFKNFDANIISLKGPHPAGNLSFILQKTNPINKTNVVWYIMPWHVVFIGRMALTGRIDFTKTVALTGPAAQNPGYYKIISGAAIDKIEPTVKDGSLRYISGDVLTGLNVGPDGFIGFYHDQVTIIKEGRYFEFMGWALPGFKKYSPSGMFFSKLLYSKKKKFDFDTNLHGGTRPFVIPHLSERYVNLDIYPSNLIKAIMINDIDQMEKLGIYEVMPEDFALMEYACISKINIQEVVNRGIETMIKES